MLFSIVLTVGLVTILGQAAGGSVDSRSVFELMVYSSLTNLPALLALSIFIAILMVMIRSWQDSEMVVWFSSGGLSLLRWISPVLRFSLPMIVLVALISLVVTPWAKAQIERTSQQFEQRDDVNRISPGRFIETEGGARVFFIEEVSEDGTRIKNVFMSQRSGRGETILKADSGEIRVNENGIRYVVLKNGRRYDTSEKADAAWRVVDFDNYELRLESKADQAYASRDVEELPLDRLLRLDTPVAKAELVWRLCWPLAAFNLALLAIPLSYTNPRAGKSLSLLLAVLIFMLLFIKYGFIGSITCITAITIYSCIVSRDNITAIVCSLIIWAIVVIRHYSNIKRLVRGEENTLKLVGKNQSKDLTEEGKAEKSDDGQKEN